SKAIVREPSRAHRGVRLPFQRDRVGSPLDGAGPTLTATAPALAAASGAASRDAEDKRTITVVKSAPIRNAAVTSSPRPGDFPAGGGGVPAAIPSAGGKRHTSATARKLLIHEPSRPLVTRNRRPRFRTVRV